MAKTKTKKRSEKHQPAPPSLDDLKSVKKGKVEKKKQPPQTKKPVSKKKGKVVKIDPKNIEEEQKLLFGKSDDEEQEEDDDVMVSDDEEQADKSGRKMFSDDEDDGELEELNQQAIRDQFGSDNDEDELGGHLNEDSEDEEMDDAFDVDSDSDGEVDAKLVAKMKSTQHILEPAKDVLPSEEQKAAEKQAPADVITVRTRILEVVKVLEDFKALREPTRSRTEYIDQLLEDICTYYGYSPYMAQKLFELFSPSEAIEFFEANEVARPITIRVNTLKTRRSDLRQALINRGVNLEFIKWTKIGLQVFESEVPIGATPEYLAGHYILQAASSFLPVMALDAKDGERILDMASAPGGKSTHIAAQMKNTGCLFANDFSKARTKSLIANIHRLGCTNTIVCNYDAREFPKVIGGFDRILLDAPCSGSGVIAKDPQVKTNRTEKDFTQLPFLQKQLLLSAIDSVDANSKTGGIIVYSTCSVMTEENEAVVDYALRKRPNVELVDTGLEIGKEGFTSFRGKKFNPKVKLTRRYYPHTYNVDGFFVAKFRKTGPSPNDNSKAGAKEKEASARAEKQEVIPSIITDSEDFASFDAEEDNFYAEQSKKKWLRKKGITPRPEGKSSTTTES